MNLTKPQGLIYDMERFSGGAIAVICGSMLMHGDIDVSILKGAVNELFRLNDALRIRIHDADGQAAQSVSDYEAQEIEVLHFANKGELDRYAQGYAQTPIALHGQLCQIQIVSLPRQYGLLVKLHHLIGDAWTLALLGTQINKLMNGQAVEAYSYADYVQAENHYLQSKRYEKDKLFITEQFKKCDEVTYLSEKQSKSLAACRKTFVVGKAQTNRINAYAKQKGTSAFMLFTAALSAFINRTKMNAEKFYIGTAVLNRSGAKENNTVGMFVNTAPMLIELDNSKSFADNLSAIEATAFSVFRHQKYNYGDVLSSIRKEFGFTEKLYDVLISYQNATVIGADVETTWYHPGSQNEALQIHIDDRDHEGVFRIHYDYLTDKFTEHEIHRMHEHICNLLFDAIENDTKKLYELSILSDNEKQKLFLDFNDTAVDYPKDKCVHRLFEEQVERIPDKVAVIACDQTLTYRQLNEQANRIAHALIERGVKVGDIVAFALSRKSDLIAVMFGILKAGAAYLPIDRDYPRDRVEYMLTDSRAKMFVTEDNVRQLTAGNDISNPEVHMSSGNLCYCIYTSGSTGKPKGVMLKHSNVVNYTNCNDYNVVRSIVDVPDGSIAAVTTCCFDIFVTESLLPLVNGMHITLADENQSKFQDQLAALLRQHPVDVLQTTPSKMKALMADETKNEYLQSLKSIVLGGEAMDEALMAQLKQQSPAKIFNIYGPTETTVWSTLTEITSEDITIGKPIANTQIYIVDQYMQPTPIGVTGELCIAGDGVGAGYLNRPELTAEKFIDNPFGEGKLYKTGDLAYWREDGNIAYVGRNDFQVKIRGLRIELGEIENAIDSIDGISQAVVVVRKNNEGRQLICAFYTGMEMDAKEIRNHIGKKLPKYMLPHIFTHIEEMPLTSSGKVNRKALPEVDLYAIDSAVEYVAPENEQQRLLCELAEQVLGVSPIGIADDFFDLGGDSLRAIELISKAHNEGIYMDLQSIFDHPTVKELWESIENGDQQGISFADVDFTEVNKVLAKNKVEHMATPQKRDTGNILLAGATGYLGMHILADYLEHDTETAYCLVRGKNQEDSTKRLQELLNFYFGNRFADMHRIEVVCADLQKDQFGLPDAEYAQLLQKIHTVINCAASVKHYGSYKYFYEVNVETTKRLIDFCFDADAVLIHTSTMSVSGNSFGDDFSGSLAAEEKTFMESTLYIGQPLDNVYARSKFEAEKAVLDAMTHGLHANIMRMGQLTNRASDGVFQMNHESNAYLKRLKAMLELGVVPAYLLDQYTEFTPIDNAANAVMTIVRHFSDEQTVFHIENPKFVLMGELIQLFGELGYHVESVSQDAFARIIEELGSDSGKRHILEAFINEIDENNRLSYESSIHIDLRFTTAYLAALGFEWTDIGTEYLRKYVEYFKRIGYLQ